MYDLPPHSERMIIMYIKNIDKKYFFKIKYEWTTYS